MTHPYQGVPITWQLAACIALAIMLVALGRYMKEQAEPLEAKLPNGVLDLESPWSSQTAADMLSLLEREGIKIARRQILLDYALLVLYPLLISLLCAMLADRLQGKIALIGVMTAWGVLLSGPLDAIENSAILQMLAGKTAAPWPQLATISATLKFTLILGGAAFIAIGLVLAVVARVKAH